MDNFNANESVSPLDATIKKQRIRAPQQHGQALFLPPTESLAEFWPLNLQTLAEHQFRVMDKPIQSLRKSARAELVRAATQYSNRYLDVQAVDSKESTPIIISGHQPRLFHPGVWFKNFSLSQLGERLGATAINLIVDNDLCGLSSITVPRVVSQTEATTQTIAYDIPGDNVPFENRECLDTELFHSFPERLSETLQGVVSKPLVHHVWQYAKSARDPENRLGYTLAAARHSLENELGLNTLEVPLSSFCKTQSFATFVAEMIVRIDELQAVYNSTLAEYRAVHSIRSKAQPVPELDFTDGWYETPFWIWSQDQPLRKPLFVRVEGSKVLLSNQAQTIATLERTELEQQLFELNQGPISIRPRALMTTMYSRLFLCDLFIHGIGGSKYDQLTDAIMARFWNCVPPVFSTITATMKLPFSFDRFTPADVMSDTIRIRDCFYHPEKFIADPDDATQRLIDEKQAWFHRRVEGGSQKPRHDAIESINEQLRLQTGELVEQAKERRELKRSQLGKTRILDSRAYSFCCFDESLPAELRSMSRM